MPSAWGWRQNSLVSVNEDGTYNLTYEYYLLKHASHFVKPGARFIPVKGEYDDMLAFRNPDGTLVLILHNGDYSEAEKTVAVDGKVISAVLPAGSFSTLTVKI
jgi:glucosylceramidase